MKIDTTKSQVTFTIKKLGFITVRGTFTNIKGDVNLDPSNLSDSKIDISIAIKGVSTNNKKRDEHLLQKDFFNIEEFPEMTFKSTSVSKEETGYVARGVICIVDNTQDVEIPFTFNNNIATGQFSLNRKDYNFGKIPTFVASNKVNISFSCLVVDLSI